MSISNIIILMWSFFTEVYRYGNDFSKIKGHHHLSAMRNMPAPTISLLSGQREYKWVSEETQVGYFFFFNWKTTNLRNLFLIFFFFPFCLQLLFKLFFSFFIHLFSLSRFWLDSIRLGLEKRLSVKGENKE